MCMSTWHAAGRRASSAVAASIRRGANCCRLPPVFRRTLSRSSRAAARTASAGAAATFSASSAAAHLHAATLGVSTALPVGGEA